MPWRHDLRRGTGAGARPRRTSGWGAFQGIGAPRAAAKREYHSSRLKETESALTQAGNRSGREVPNTSWIFAGYLRSQASRTASAVVSWRWRTSAPRELFLSWTRIDRVEICLPKSRYPEPGGFQAWRRTPFRRQYPSFLPSRRGSGVSFGRRRCRPRQNHDAGGNAVSPRCPRGAAATTFFKGRRYRDRKGHKELLVDILNDKSLVINRL
jgi:hypothetical protein